MLLSPKGNKYVNKIDGVFEECMTAIKHNDIIKLGQIVDQHTNISSGNLTILQYAIYNRLYDVLFMLLPHKNIVITQNDMDIIIREFPIDIINKLLHSLSSFKDKINVNECFIKMVNNVNIDIGILKILFNHVNINYKDKFGNTALLNTIENNDTDKMNFIITHPQIDILATNLHGQNALIKVVEQTNYVYASTLLTQLKNHNNFKVIINQPNNLNETPILISTKKDNLELFKLFYNYGVDLNCVDINGQSLLHHAIKNNNNEIFEILINDKNVNINIQDYDGVTPLMMVVNNNDMNKIYRLLNRENLDLNVVNNLGQNVVDIIIKQKYANIKINKDLGMFGSNQYMDGYAYLNECWETSLIGKNNNFDNKTIDDPNDLINLLIQKNINLNNFDINNKSLLTYIIDNDDNEMFNIIINSKMFDVNAQDSLGNTYLMYLFGLLNKNKQPTPQPQRKITNSYTMMSPIKGGNIKNGGMDIRGDIMGIDKPESSFSTFSMTNFCDMKGEIKPTLNPPISTDWFDGGRIETEFNPVNTFINNAIISDNKHYLTFFTQLLNHPKININMQNYLNKSILHMIAETNDSNLLMKVIKSKGINLDVRDNNNYTPVMIAVECKLWTNVRMLLSNGANPDFGITIMDDESKFIYNTIVSKYTKVVENDNTDKMDIGMQSLGRINENKKGWIF